MAARYDSITPGSPFHLKKKPERTATKDVGVSASDIVSTEHEKKPV
jgi:hypothetical protein